MNTKIEELLEKIANKLDMSTEALWETAKHQVLIDVASSCFICAFFVLAYTWSAKFCLKKWNAGELNADGKAISGGLLVIFGMVLFCLSVDTLYNFSTLIVNPDYLTLKTIIRIFK